MLKIFTNNKIKIFRNMDNKINVKLYFNFVKINPPNLLLFMH